MRGFIGVLFVWAICTGTTLAQDPEPTNPTTSRLPMQTPFVAPLIEPSSGGTEGSGCFFAEVEFLLRWFKPVCEVPTVLTVGHPADRVPGALGQPGTKSAIGEAHKFEFPMTPGVQLTVGWDRGDGAIGAEVTGFLMERASNSQHFSS